MVETLIKEKSPCAYIARENERCLIVYEELNRGFRQAEAHAAPYLNIFALFMHDFMRIITAYVLHRMELNSQFGPRFDSLPPSPKTLPYVGYRDVAFGIRLEEKNFSPWRSQYGLFSKYGYRWKLSEYKWTARSAMAAKTRFHIKPKCVWIKGPGVDMERLHSKLLETGFRADFRAPVTIDIPGREEQLKCLRSTLLRLADRLEFSSAAKPLYQILESHVKARSKERVPRRFPFDAVITGTQLALEYRFMGALGKHHGVPVISVSHGEQEGMLNEPGFGYGDRTFADYTVGYGEPGATVPENDDLRQSLYTTPEYVCSDSNYIRTRMTEETIPELDSLYGKKVMYAPSQFYGQVRYGPYHDAPDGLYVRWQEALFEAIPGLILKRHPKEIYNPSLMPRNAKHVTTGYLEDCAQEADVLVFDIVSGATCVAAVANKPIVYLNIGLRNFTEAGEAAIRSRCVWIDVDPANPENLRERIEANFHTGTRTNALLRTFSLHPDNPAPREQTIVETLVRAFQSESEEGESGS